MVADGIIEAPWRCLGYTNNKNLTRTTRKKEMKEWRKIWIMFELQFKIAFDIIFLFNLTSIET